jgi:hypothetical protein
VPSWIEAGDPGGRELHGARAVSPGEIGVDPPAQIGVEALGPVNVRNRKDGNLELHVDALRARTLDCRFAVCLNVAHFQILLSCLESIDAVFCQV